MIATKVVMDIGYAATEHWQKCLWHDDTCFKMHVFIESFTFGH